MFVGARLARIGVLHLSFGLVAPCFAFQSAAQTPAPAGRVAPQRGTVKAISGNNLTITTDGGQEMSVAVSGVARIQRLAPGSTDLKTAESAALTDIAVGDRVLVAGAPGDAPSSFNATRVILMKSADIAQKRESEQQDWQKRGTGGIVGGVDASSGAITVASGARKLQIDTSTSTVFRRYAGGSVKFEDAKPGTLAEIQPGDQLLARGAKSDDGSSVKAEEVVSGSFKNLSGTILSIDSASNTVSLKDLATKRNVKVQLTPNTALHRLPAQAATMLAARAHSGSATGAAPAASGAAGASSTPRSSTEPAGSARPEGMHRSGGGDLSQIVARLPASALTDIHNGDAVMIVAEQNSSDPNSLTAITLLAGVEPILAASPSGSPAMTLSPWSVGSGAPEGGGSQ